MPTAKVYLIILSMLNFSCLHFLNPAQNRCTIQTFRLSNRPVKSLTAVHSHLRHQLLQLVVQRIQCLARVIQAPAVLDQLQKQLLLVKRQRPASVSPRQKALGEDRVVVALPQNTQAFGASQSVDKRERVFPFV